MKLKSHCVSQARRATKRAPSALFFLTSLVLAAPFWAQGNQELVELSKDPKLWPITGRDYGLTRHSPLKQITTGNVRNLRLVWSFSSGTLRGHEGQPLVIGTRMYLVSAFPNYVYCLDISKGDSYELIWKYAPKQDEKAVATACCDTVNRGLSYADGKIVFGTLDGQLICLDAKTGKEIWNVRHCDPYKGETQTPAPLIVKDKVIAGYGGDEFAARGRLSCYELATGKKLWDAWSTGTDEEVRLAPDFNKAHPEYRQRGDLGVKTYPGDEWKRGGGCPWGWYSYDPNLDLIYYSTGNPGLWSPTYRTLAKTHEEANTGAWDNKWSMTIFARRADTGEAVWAYQMTPFDQWDYDGVNENVLVDMVVDGVKRPCLVHFDRNGFAYVLDRRDGTLLRAHKFVTVNWAERVDLKTGRPVKVKEYSPFELGVAVEAFPSAMGGKDQQPVAVDPKEPNLFYAPTNNWGMKDEPQQRAHTQQGMPYVFANVLMFPEKPGILGRFKCFDVLTGKTKWEIPERFPTWSGALVTDGGLVFYGTLDGWFRAVDRRTGKILWQIKLGSGVIGNPITYQIGAKQYVSVWTGIGGWIGLPVTAGLDPNDPYGALGAAGLAFSNGFDKITLGGCLYTFALP
jgi:PQQ-dependent dehydrogenase (methanol/ethanol family)